MEQALYRFRPRQTAQITTLRAILTPLFSCCTIAQCAGAQLASLAERNFSFAAQVRRPQISLSEKKSAVTYKKWNEMRPLYRFRPRCEVNNRGEKDQPERKNVLDFAFFLCASCFLFICPGQHTATLSAKHSNKNLPVHSTLQRFEFEEEFCCWPSILSTLRWLESEALPFHWVSFPSWCFENLLGQPSSMEMQPYGLFRSVVKVRTLLQQTHISSDKPKINTTWPKIKTGFLKKTYFVDMPTKHCWARKSTPDTMKESLLRLSARGWTEMDLCFPPNRQKLFHWWVQTHLWGTFQREKKQLAIDSSVHPAFFVNVFSSFAKWWTRKADIFFISANTGKSTGRLLFDSCVLQINSHHWELGMNPTIKRFIFIQKNWVFEIPK